MLKASKDQLSVLQALEVSESTYQPWRNQYGGIISEEARRLKQLEDEKKRLKELVADLSLDYIQDAEIIRGEILVSPSRK